VHASVRPRRSGLPHRAVRLAAPVGVRVLNSWTVLAILRWTKEYLSEKQVPESRLTAELLLAGTLGVKRLDLYLQFDRPLAPEELAEFKVRLRRRVRREPLQYIEGEAAFREIRLRVDDRVLIPRPETELLVEEVLRWAAAKESPAALDVGTGSGAIALSLAREGAFGRLVATDVSLDALDLARANADRLGVASVEFRHGALYLPVAGERFDVIVSNPPYIATTEATSLAPEVVGWEPHAALFGGETGLEVIEPLVADASEYLLPGGLLALEIGAAQAGDVCGLIEATREFASVGLKQDYAGRDRIVLAERAAGPRKSYDGVWR
jgi:release factor glutamine methyltransferase